MPAQQTTRFFLTVNGVTEDVAHALPQHPAERYACWQLERGANGNLHVQGYMELHKRATFAAIRKVFADAGYPPPHVEAAQGSPEQCRAYCSKEDTREAGPWERGEFGRGGQGKRNDLADAVATLKETGSMRAVAEQHPTVFVKFSRGLRELQAELEVKPSDAEFVPRVWQQDVLDWLTGPADDRHILWVTDGVGNKGKSRLARHLILEHNAINLEGRVQDMAFAYNKEPIVIIDVARAQADNMRHLYSFAEKLKNGCVFSTKYEPRQKLFSPPHVIFFSNSTWEREFWSEDRVIEINLVTDYE